MPIGYKNLDINNVPPIVNYERRYLSRIEEDRERIKDY